MGRLLDMREVCERLGVGIETTRAWRKRNVGPPSFLVGGSIRYDEDDLNAYLAAQRETTLVGASLPGDPRLNSAREDLAHPAAETDGVPQALAG